MDDDRFPVRIIGKIDDDGTDTAPTRVVVSGEVVSDDPLVLEAKRSLGRAYADLKSVVNFCAWDAIPGGQVLWEHIGDVLWPDDDKPVEEWFSRRVWEQRQTQGDQA